MDNLAGLFNAWEDAWGRRIRESEPYWNMSRGFSFPYNQNAPSIAYDPLSIPQRPLGPFRHLRYTPPPEANALTITRECLVEKRPHGDLLHELKNSLLTDPCDASLILLPNRWPRTPQHSLLVTRTLHPQKLTLHLISAEFRWVSYGVVVEFHKWKNFVNHFHAHVFPIGQAPIAMANSSFKADRSYGGVNEGLLSDYPVPHIAYFSQDEEQLKRVVHIVVSTLDSCNRWFSQVLLRHRDPDGLLFVCFIRAFEAWINNFAFNVIGLVRTEKQIDEQYAIESANMLYVRNGALDVIKAQLRGALYGI